VKVGSDRRDGQDRAYPLTASYSPYDVAATIYEALGVDAATVLHDRQGRSIPMLPEGRPIRLL